MKKSVNFNGMKRYRNLGADDLIATLRFLGMSDEEIKDEMLRIQTECQPNETNAPATAQPQPRAGE